MPGVSGNKSLSAPVETLEEPETVETSVIPGEANVTPETNNVILSEAKNLAEAAAGLNTGELY